MYTNNIYENLKKALYNNQITTEEAPVLKKICKLIERMAGIHSAVRVEPLDGYINVFKDYVVEVRETTNTKNALKSFDNKYIFRDYVTIANLNAAKVAELLEKAFDEEDSELLTSLMYKVKKETERLNDDRETAIEREKVQYNIPQIYKEQAKKILELFYDKSELEEIHLLGITESRNVFEPKKEEIEETQENPTNPNRGKVVNKSKMKIPYTPV